MVINDKIPIRTTTDKNIHYIWYGEYSELLEWTFILASPDVTAKHQAPTTRLQEHLIFFFFLLIKL